jgi:hypothetical protein
MYIYDEVSLIKLTDGEKLIPFPIISIEAWSLTTCQGQGDKN